MTCANTRTDSDSVNLGSNPSSPATANADVSGISQPSGAAEKSEIAEQTAHTGRTEVGTALTKAQLRLLRDMAAGAVIFAALREPRDCYRDGVVLSEGVGIRVWKDGKVVRRVRAKTADPLYLAGMINHGPGQSGDRDFEITDAGRAALAAARSPAPPFAGCSR